MPTVYGAPVRLLLTGYAPLIYNGVVTPTTATLTLIPRSAVVLATTSSFAQDADSSIGRTLGRSLRVRSGRSVSEQLAQLGRSLRRRNSIGLPTEANEGDLALYEGGNWVLLPKGLEGSVLTISSGKPRWV